VYPNSLGRARARLSYLSIALALIAVPLAACSGTSDPADAGPAGGPADGGPANAEAFGHCAGADGGFVFQPVSADACHPDAGDAAPPDDDGSDFGATLYGTSGYDDDCKYQVSWTSTPIRQNADVTFTVTVKLAATDQPASGGTANNDTYIEAFLNETHPGDTASAQTTESSAGVYTIGPVRFDAPGVWTVRFHVFGDCEDLSEDSPHGHAAFYVDVP